ncbi:MAG: hypothetical protein AVDCRST_MAG20-801 [uncultured Acidimicrobiales bacterium]|uniref:Alkaline shock response membrane anchor protein AmaP n=1 Tax=uncultured Acidimicrobiales bacterium TaxID=310071 RepID=A0A6J4HJU9_9ACTN|nr:MAG: hypothetical protein AVDCRST_MAG20-801 [uncultured Acidimicrobiales bacterium]
MTQLDRVNRTVVSLLGLLLLAVGVYGLLRGAGAFGDDRAGDRLRTQAMADFVADNDHWLWAAVAAVALLIALGALLWLLAQLRPSPSLGQLPVVTGEAAAGRTTLDTSAISAAVTRDIEVDPDVNSARVRVVPVGDAMGLDVRAVVADHGDVHAVRRRIETVVLERARAALGRPDLTATLRLRLGDPGTRTVF